MSSLKARMEQMSRDIEKMYSSKKEVTRDRTNSGSTTNTTINSVSKGTVNSRSENLVVKRLTKKAVVDYSFEIALPSDMVYSIDVNKIGQNRYLSAVTKEDLNEKCTLKNPIKATRSITICGEPLNYFSLNEDRKDIRSVKRCEEYIRKTHNRIPVVAKETEELSVLYVSYKKKAFFYVLADNSIYKGTYTINDSTDNEDCERLMKKLADSIRLCDDEDQQIEIVTSLPVLTYEKRKIELFGDIHILVPDQAQSILECIEQDDTVLQIPEIDKDLSFLAIPYGYKRGFADYRNAPFAFSFKDSVSIKNAESIWMDPKFDPTDLLRKKVIKTGIINILKNDHARRLAVVYARKISEDFGNICRSFVYAVLCNDTVLLGQAYFNAENAGNTANKIFVEWLRQIDIFDENDKEELKSLISSEKKTLRSIEKELHSTESQKNEIIQKQKKYQASTKTRLRDLDGMISKYTTLLKSAELEHKKAIAEKTEAERKKKDLEDQIRHLYYNEKECEKKFNRSVIKLEKELEEKTPILRYMKSICLLFKADEDKQKELMDRAFLFRKSRRLDYEKARKKRIEKEEEIKEYERSLTNVEHSLSSLKRTNTEKIKEYNKKINELTKEKENNAFELEKLNALITNKQEEKKIAQQNLSKAEEESKLIKQSLEDLSQRLYEVEKNLGMLNWKKKPIGAFLDELQKKEKTLEKREYIKKQKALEEQKALERQKAQEKQNALKEAEERALLEKAAAAKKEAEQAEEMRKIVTDNAPITREDLVTLLRKKGYTNNFINQVLLKYVSDHYYKSMYRADFIIMPEERLKGLNEKLTDDFYYLDEVKQIYSSLYEDADPEEINFFNLKKMGFEYYTNCVLKNFESLSEYFRSLLLANDITDISEMRKRFRNDRSWTQCILALKKDYEIVEFEPDQIITYKRLHSNGIDKKDLKDFCDEVYELTEEGEYFSIKKLWNSGFDLKLFGYGFTDLFYSNILCNDDRFTYENIFSNIILCKSQSPITTQSFLIDQIERAGSTDINYLMEDINEIYGCEVKDKREILSRIKDTDIYYDNIMERLYANKDMFYNELYDDSEELYE